MFIFMATTDVGKERRAHMKVHEQEAVLEDALMRPSGPPQGKDELEREGGLRAPDPFGGLPTSLSSTRTASSPSTFTNGDDMKVRGAGRAKAMQMGRMKKAGKRVRASGRSPRAGRERGREGR